MNDKIGSLWTTTSRDGNTKYLSGNIEWKGEKFYISIFKNKKKNKDKHPDYHILWRKDNQNNNQNDNNQFDSEDIPF